MNSSGSASDPSPNDSRRSCRSASPLISRSRACARSTAAASTGTAAASVIACSSAAPAEPADLDPRMKRLLSGAERSLAEAQKLLAISLEGSVG